MNAAAKLVVSFALFAIFLYFSITATQRYFAAQEEVEIAQKQYDQALAEYKAANKEFEVEANRLAAEMNVNK
jgi:multidrug efflux pump subunit AcrA (membrane-fusion protein)